MKHQFQFFTLWFLGMLLPAMAQTPDPESALVPPSPGTVQVWLTTSDASKKLARQADLTWSTGQAAATSNVTVNEATKFQQIDGFGATILDSSLWDADPAVREELMRLLFSRASGIGLSMIRVPMGLSGLTGPHRTYNDLPTGQTDPTLSQFSIAGDELWKLPMMRQAKALNPELTLMGTPWSAPAWMKDSGSLGYGKLKPEYDDEYAQYFVKWLNAWRAEGLGISAITMQNEPHYEPYWYQGMRMEPADQAALGLQLGPAFKQAGHSTRIICWDHNCDEMSYPIAVMDDPAANNWIHGAAFHAYAGTTSDIDQFTNEHPDKDVYFTEQTGSYPSRGFGGSLAWHLRNIFLVPSLNGARSNLVWQLARKMDDTLSGDRPFVRIAPDGKGYELHGEYYETGHFSKFVRKGARRIETNNSRDATTRYFNGPLLYAAYQNPDGSKTMVVLNDSSSTQSFTLEDLGISGRRVSYSMPAGAVASFLWRDATGGSGLAATYFDNADLTGLSEQRVDPVIDFTWAPETYVSADFTRPAESPMHSLGPIGFSARWEGQVLPTTSETHTFHATTSDGVRLWVNGQLIIDQWIALSATESSGSISLTAGQPATVKMEYFSSASTGGGRAALAWSTPTIAKQIIPRERLYPPVVAVVPPPPLGLVARSPGSNVQLTWSAAPTAASYTVRRATSSAGPFTVLASGLTTTSYSDTSAATGTAYTYQVTAVNAQGEGTPSAPRFITPRGSTLTAPWTQQDIGSVGTAGIGGNAGDHGETVVLGGAGGDIWNSADAFRFAWLPLNGDGSITARVASMEETSPWAKAGLMIRESLASNSAYVDIVCTPANGVSVQSRASTGAAATGTTLNNLFAPRWLKLIRSGDTFTGYHSMDGVTWTQTTAPVTVAMGTNVSIGLVVCSGQTSGLNLVEFDGISAPGLPLPRPPAPQEPEALPGNATINLAWAPAAYATGYEVSRATVSGGPYAPLASVSTTQFTDTSATNDTTYYYVIRATNAAGSSAATAEIFATPRSSFLPAGWINRDIGSVGLPGSVSLTGGVYAIQAAGAGVWNVADGFNYSYQSASGDGSMTVRVDSLTNVNYYSTKSGLMFRSSSAADAEYAFVAVTPAGEVKFEYRSATGASAASQGSVYAATPRWLRLERVGTILRASSSANGSTWTQVGGDLTLDFAGDFLAGIAVSANNTTTRTTSVLSQLSVTGFAGPLTPKNLTANAGLDGVRLAWDAVATATSYRVKRMASGESTYTVVGTVSTPGFLDTSVLNRTTYSYVDENVVSNVPYYYVVSSTNSFGESINSTEVSAIREVVSPPNTPLKVLVLGNTQALNASEAAFPPAGVADELRQILLADPALANRIITVTAADLYQSKAYTQTFTQTLSSRSLMSGYYWPPTRSATLALLAQDWDHVVMIEDPYVASRFPEYAFEGVRAIARDVRQAGGQPSLVMTWTSSASPDASNNTARFAEMAYRVGVATGVPVIPAGYAWNHLAAGVKGSGSRPNLQGNYTTAAAIYSHITTRNAATSAHVPASLAQADRDAMASAAHDAVAAAPAQTHFTGGYTGPTHFAAPLLKKRSFTYTDFNSSTEWGFRAGLASVLAIARMDWTQTLAGYQSLPTTGFVYDFAQTRDYLDADATKWKVFGTFDYQDESGEESMVTGMDRVMYRAPLPEQETSAANITAARIADGTFFVPVRVLWARLRTEQAAISAQPDGHHLSDAYNQGVASMMFTLLTGRCGVGSEPSDTASTDWQNWICRKTGYEIAWQYATLRERVPGMEVLPASTSATTVTPGTSTTLTVRFLYPPTENVTVSLASDNPTAASVSPTTLTFTPQNYKVAQTVTITGLTGTAGSENFNATVSTTSADPVFDGLSDAWAYTTLRPAAGTWIADSSGLWTDVSKWSGGVANGTGTADFSAIDITADRTVSLDAALSVGGLVFGDTATNTAAGWTINPNGNSANLLTLAGTSPAITVNALGAAKTASISAVMTGTGGLAKNGQGTLSLAAPNTYTGGTVVNAGTLQLAIGSAVGAIRGALTIQSSANVLSTVASSFGFNIGTKVDTLTINNGTLTHNPAGGTLTLSSVGITMTGGTMDSTGSAGFDFYDASALGGPNLNTSVTTFASNNTATIAGKINLRAGDSDTTGTVFTVADGAAVADLIVSASMVNGSAQGAASRVQKSGPGRMLLSGNNTYSGGTTLNAGTLVAASPTALGATSTVTFNAGSGLVLELATPDGTMANSYILDMGSNRFNSVLVNRANLGSADYPLGTLRLGASTMTFNRGPNISGNAVVRFDSLDLSAGNNDRPVIVNGDAILQVGNAAIVSNPNISKRLQLDGSATANTLGPISNGSGTGVLSLIKAGAGKWTLTGNNTYTGTTTVHAGELVLETAALPDNAAVNLSTGGSLNLNFLGTDIIGSLVINGVTQVAGTWGALASSAPNRSALITGPGTLVILSTAYTNWANANGLGTAADARVPSADPDGDSIANGLEWVLGGNPLANSAHVLPRLSASSKPCVFSFNRDPASIGSVPLSVEWSADLIIWNRIPISVSSSGPDANGITVGIKPVNNAPDEIEVSVPESNAISGRIFLRLNAGNP